MSYSLPEPSGHGLKVKECDREFILNKTKFTQLWLTISIWENTVHNTAKPNLG